MLRRALLCSLIVVGDKHPVFFHEVFLFHTISPFNSLRQSPIITEVISRDPESRGQPYPEYVILPRMTRLRGRFARTLHISDVIEYYCERRSELSDRVCPWWLGWLLASPLRGLLQDPDEVVGPYVEEGMMVLEVGPGMGFFSLPLARLVGKTGRVVCVDVQRQMVEGLMRRAKKTDLSGRIDARTCRRDSLELGDLAGRIDFALLFALVHEVPDKERLFSEVHSAMKQNGKMLLAEPRGHVTQADFEKTVSLAQSGGFEFLRKVEIRRSHAVLMRRRGEKLDFGAAEQ
jgi:SAM-dependent methyltransferase